MKWTRRRLQGLLTPLWFAILSLCLYFGTPTASEGSQRPTGRRSLLVWEDPLENCTSPGLEDFPGFPGGSSWTLALCALVVLYLFSFLASVCDGYFLTAIKLITQRLGISREVSGATIMAMGVSCPDLFINLVATFVTEGDLGVGTVVGCSLVNLSGIPALCALLTATFPLAVWPLTRDAVAYALSLAALTAILNDSTVQLWEASTLILIYAVYMLLLSFDKRIKSTFGRLWNKEETSWPLLNKCDVKYDSEMGLPSYLTSVGELRDNSSSPVEAETARDPGPEGCCWRTFDRCLRCLNWPGDLLLSWTVPDCGQEDKRHLYPATFVVCLAWIGVVSYLVAWTISIAGYILEIPDSLMGLTFIAVGMSVPQATANVIVCKQGDGCMSVSNSLGSNTFDVLICLGLPWFIKVLTTGQELRINSQGMGYSAFLLLAVTAILYTSIALSGFNVNKQVGVVCLSMYFCCTVIAVLLEMNYFFENNLPLCALDGVEL